MSFTARKSLRICARVMTIAAREASRAEGTIGRSKRRRRMAPFSRHIGVVVGDRTEEKVLRPNASAVVAAVQHAEFRVLVVRKKPRDAVRTLWSLWGADALAHELPVSLAVGARCPFPALTKIRANDLPVATNLRPKPIDKRRPRVHVERRHRSHLALNSLQNAAAHSVMRSDCSRHLKHSPEPCSHSPAWHRSHA
jgi:hypothetical protein